MTQPLNFTSLAPAPVGCLLDCAKTGDAANNLKLARTIDAELDGRGSEQHVKIKVGTLRVLVKSIQSLDKLSASLEAALDERRGELIEVRDGLIEWRTYAMRLLANSFMTYPTSEAVDDNLRIMITASIEHEQRKLKVVSKERDELRNTANAADQLRKAAELERDDVINLNRNAAEEIASLTKRSERFDQTVVDLVRQRDKNGQQANQLACEVNDLKKQRERLTHLADDYRRDLDAAAQRCVALTNDAQALTKQRDEVTTRLANAKLQIADLKRRLDGEVVQSAAVYSNIRSHAEAQENAFLKRIAVLEGENRELATKLADAGLEIANYQRLVEDLKAGTAVDRDTVKRLEETVQRQYGQLNEWYDWAVNLICSPSQLGGEGLRTAITQAMRKRRERVESLDAILKDVVSQRDAWVIWARGYTDAPAGIHNTEQLIDMVKAKVKGSQHTFQGTLKVTKLKDDVVVSDEPVKEYSLPGVRFGTMILNGAIRGGGIQASKVTFSDEMKAAIREVIRDEIADLNKAVVDILSKMRK